MDMKTIKNDWTMIKDAIQEKWEKLRDEDIEEIRSDLNKTVAKLQKTYGYAKEKAEQEYKDFKNFLDKSFKERDEQEKRERGTNEIEYPESRRGSSGRGESDGRTISPNEKDIANERKDSHGGIHSRKPNDDRKNMEERKKKEEHRYSGPSKAS